MLVTLSGHGPDHARWVSVAQPVYLWVTATYLLTLINSMVMNCAVVNYLREFVAPMPKQIVTLPVHFPGLSEGSCFSLPIKGKMDEVDVLTLRVMLTYRQVMKLLCWLPGGGRLHRPYMTLL